MKVFLKKVFVQLNRWVVAVLSTLVTVGQLFPESFSQFPYLIPLVSVCLTVVLWVKNENKSDRDEKRKDRELCIKEGELDIKKREVDIKEFEVKLKHSEYVRKKEY